MEWRKRGLDSGFCQPMALSHAAAAAAVVVVAAAAGGSAGVAAGVR